LLLVSFHFFFFPLEKTRSVSIAVLFLIILPYFLQGSSDEFIDANIQLALVVARKLKELKGTRTCIVSSSFIKPSLMQIRIIYKCKAMLIYSLLVDFRCFLINLKSAGPHSYSRQL
jgi:hypothetical protein